MINKIISAATHIRFMALAIDIMDGSGPSTEMHPQLQLKKTN